MNQRTLGILSIAVLAVLVIGTMFWLRTHQSQQLSNASSAPVVAKVALDAPAPEFAVATTQGLFDLAKTTKPVFLEVFATWCPHCQRETVVINKLYDAYKSKVAFVAVSGSATGMDGTSPASELDTLNFKTKFNVRYPIAYDGLLTVAGSYLQGGFPTMVVIDSKKKVAFLTSGEVAYGDLATQLQKVH